MMKKLSTIAVILSLFHSPVVAENNLPLPQIGENKEREIDNKSKSSHHKQTNNNQSIRIKIGVDPSENYLYLPLATTICIFLNDDDSKACRVTQYKTSRDAIKGMLDGDVDLVLTNSAIGDFIIKSSDSIGNKIRFVASLFDEKAIFLTRKDLNAKQLSSFKGLSINMSKEGSVNRIIMNYLIKKMHWQLTDFKATNEFSDDEAVKGICKGTVDGILVVAEEMNKSLKEVTRVCELNMISFSQDEIESITQDIAYIPSKIIGGTYVGMPNDINTVAIRALLLSTSDVPSNKISYLISEISKHINEIKLLHYSLNNLSMEDALHLTKIAPIHDGVNDFMAKNNSKG